MSFDERIKDKIEEIENLVSQLQEILPDSLDIYIRNFEKRAACERYFETIIESVVDLSFLLIKFKKMKIPQEDTEAFLILAEKGIISKNLAERFRQAKGMRNILAHEYGKVDNELVFEAITSELLSDVREFLKEINKL